MMETIATLEELYPSLTTLHTRAGWARAGNPGIKPAKSRFSPNLWRYREIHSALDVAARLVSTDLAERRNLLLINPGAGAEAATASTLITAYQMILAGERARSHRHTPNALRLVVDSADGLYTIVDGFRYDMAPGDVVLTPNWCWHGHANESLASGYWIDYLDVPLVMSLEPMYFESFPEEYEKLKSSAGPSLYRYPWSETQRRLAGATLERSGCYGRQIALDAYRFPTIGLFMCALDCGSRTTGLSTTANNIYTVVTGSGHSTIGGETFAWERGDVFVAPSLYPHYHEPDGDAVLFRVTDEPLFSALGWLRC